MNQKENKGVKPNPQLFRNDDIIVMDNNGNFNINLSKNIKIAILPYIKIDGVVNKLVLKKTQLPNRYTSSYITFECFQIKSDKNPLEAAKRILGEQCNFNQANAEWVFLGEIYPSRITNELYILFGVDLGNISIDTTSESDENIIVIDPSLAMLSNECFIHSAILRLMNNVINK